MRAAALTFGAAVLAVALSGIFSPSVGPATKSVCVEADSCGPGYEVTSRSVNEIVSVGAFNVVVAPAMSRDELVSLASGFAARHKGERTIVYLFSSAAGQERYQFGLIPSSADGRAHPAPDPLAMAGWIGLVDFAPTGELVLVRWGPASN